MATSSVERSTQSNASVRHISNLLLRVSPTAPDWIDERTAEIVELRAGDVVLQRGEQVRQIYFPETAVLGVVSEVADGRRMQTMSIGREGSSAAVSLVDGTRSMSELVVQLSGRAVRVDVQRFLDEVGMSPGFEAATRAHARRLFEHAQNGIACVNFHPIGERLATWLLTNHDRVDRCVMVAGHQTLANIHGVRRATISEIMMELRRHGVIEYSRTALRVIDRDALRARACACYVPVDALQEEFARLATDAVTEVRGLFRAEPPPAPSATQIRASQQAYAAALKAATNQLATVTRSDNGETFQFPSAEIKNVERSIRAYVMLLRDNTQPPETTLASVKRVIEQTALTPDSKEQLREWALQWMIEAYYSGTPR